MKYTIVARIVVLAACLSASAVMVLGQAVSPDCLSHARDYGFMWWAYGWRGRSPEGHRVLCVQTNRYGLAFDIERTTLSHFGWIADPAPENEALIQPNEAVLGLPAVQLDASIEVNGRTYRAVSVAAEPADAHIIESGRFLQRVELHKLRFEDQAGAPLTGVETHYEIVCWPDRFAILLHMKHEAFFDHPVMSMSLTLEESEHHVGRTDGDARYIRHAGDAGAGLAVLRVPGTEWFAETEGMNCAQLGLRTTETECWEGGRTRTLALVVLPFVPDDEIPIADRVASELRPREPTTLRATGIAPYEHPLEVVYDHQRGWYRVELGRVDADGWMPAKDLDRLERVALRLRNDELTPRTVRLLFARDYDFCGIHGFCPMIRDSKGFPTGLPVQISKNWHKQWWLHGATMVHLPARSVVDAEFTVAYAHWGGVPSVSHSQLCLVGWGQNQLWHQVAIGSSGESICYDPDVCLQRSMIDDMRPLMVRSWFQERWRSPRWGWTNNVGGADFLVYFDENGKKQYLSRMRSSYERYGPNLSEVTYAGRTEDSRIAARITVAHFRSDDIVRGLYRVRYEVKKPTPFSRLAFFQLGADNYNDHQFNTISHGNADGLVEEWPVKRGDPGYNRTGIACAGRLPWFSLHDAIPKGHGKDGVYRPESDGAWANRGFVVRGWRARLGGQEAPTPYAAEYRTRDGPPSALVELSAPPGIAPLEPGDFVEADIELLVLPMSAGDYYGPNEALRKALETDGNTWRLVHREAVGNDLIVSAHKGQVKRSCPLLIHCDDAGAAEFTIRGGVGYIPITLSGVHDYRECILEARTGQGWQRVDQSVHGNDFWQADYDSDSGTWDLTFNVSCDRDAGVLGERTYRLR